MHPVPWPDSRCIVCLRETPLSLEHIIPHSIGGIIACKFLCKQCNDRFGHSLDYTLKASAPIRLAISSLKDRLPDLFMQMESGQPYVAQLGNQLARSKLSTHFQISETRLDDGSLLVPERRQSGHIERMLRKSGLGKDKIADALDRLEKADTSKLVELSDDYSAKKWVDVKVTPDLLNKAINAVAALKIAYGFLALCIGSAIYNPVAQLQRCRRVLTSLDEDAARQLVSFRVAKSDYDSFHGLYLDGTANPATVQIRLFGKIAVVVGFQGLRIAQKLVFTQSIEDRSFEVRKID